MQCELRRIVKVTWYINHTITNELNVLLSKRLTDQLFWYLQPLPIKENHPDTFQFCCCGLYARKGGGRCCGLDARTLRWGIPPSGGKGALLAHLWLLLHNALVFTLLVFIFQNILAVILWKQFPVIRCAVHWRSIEYHVGGRDCRRIAYLWRLCVALVRCVALTHAPGHRPLNKRDQCCFFSMASNFFLVLYLNATNAKCAMF